MEVAFNEFLTLRIITKMSITSDHYEEDLKSRPCREIKRFIFPKFSLPHSDDSSGDVGRKLRVQRGWWGFNIKIG